MASIIMPVNSWSDFKVLLSAKSLQIQYSETSAAYELYMAEVGIFLWNMSLPKDNGADVTDFENNYKPTANRPQLQVPQQAFSSKILTNGKKLFIRNIGFQEDLEEGVNVINYEIGYPQVKLTGAEIIGGEKLDYLDFEIYDTEGGTYSGTPNLKLNQFGYSINIAPDFYRREAPYDADLYAGMKLRIRYTSISTKSIGINLIMNEVKS